MSRIKHIEFAGRNGPALEAFYSALFGWSIVRKETGPGFQYGDIRVEGEPTAGIRHEPEGKDEVVVYVEVDDLEGTVDKARVLGAKVRISPMQYGDLRFALLEDPEGNPIGITQQ